MSYSPLELAEAYVKAGELDDALDALNEHLIHDDEDDDARRLRVQVLLRLGTPDHLLGALDDLDGLQEPTPQDAYTRSVVLEKQDALDEALAAARQATTDPDAAREARAVARVLGLLRKQGDLTAALELALERNWVQQAADLAADLNDPARALPYYNEAVTRAEKLGSVTSAEIAANIKARVLLKRANVHLALQNNAEAEADYQAAAEVVPDDPMIFFNRGLLALRRGDSTAAQTLLETAHARANKMLCEHMTREAEGDEALKLLWARVTG